MKHVLPYKGVNYVKECELIYPTTYDTLDGESVNDLVNFARHCLELSYKPIIRKFIQPDLNLGGSARFTPGRIDSSEIFINEAHTGKLIKILFHELVHQRQWELTTLHLHFAETEAWHMMNVMYDNYKKDICVKLQLCYNVHDWNMLLDNNPIISTRILTGEYKE